MNLTKGPPGGSGSTAHQHDSTADGNGSTVTPRDTYHLSELTLPKSVSHLWDRSALSAPLRVSTKAPDFRMGLHGSAVSSIQNAAAEAGGRTALAILSRQHAATDVITLELMAASAVPPGHSVDSVMHVHNAASTAADWVRPHYLLAVPNAVELKDDITAISTLASNFQAACDSQLPITHSRLLPFTLQTCRRPGGAVEVIGTLVRPAMSLTFTPLHRCRIYECRLAASLMHEAASEQAALTAAEGSGMFRTGPLTVDQSRSLVPLDVSDNLASLVPLVGVWVAGVSKVAHNLVVSAALSFYINAAHPAKALAPDGSFLVLGFFSSPSSSRCHPQAYECAAASPRGVPLLPHRLSATLAPATPIPGPSGACVTKHAVAVVEQPHLMYSLFVSRAPEASAGLPLERLAARKPNPRRLPASALPATKRVTQDAQENTSLQKASSVQQQQQQQGGGGVLSAHWPPASRSPLSLVSKGAAVAPLADDAASEETARDATVRGRGVEVHTAFKDVPRPNTGAHKEEMLAAHAQAGSPAFRGAVAIAPVHTTQPLTGSGPLESVSDVRWSEAGNKRPTSASTESAARSHSSRGRSCMLAWQRELSHKTPSSKANHADAEGGAGHDRCAQTGGIHSTLITKDRAHSQATEQAPQAAAGNACTEQANGRGQRECPDAHASAAIHSGMAAGHVAGSSASSRAPVDAAPADNSDLVEHDGGKRASTAEQSMWQSCVAEPPQGKGCHAPCGSPQSTASGRPAAEATLADMHAPRTLPEPHALPPAPLAGVSQSVAAISNTASGTALRCSQKEAVVHPRDTKTPLPPPANGAKDAALRVEGPDDVECVSAMKEGSHVAKCMAHAHVCEGSPVRKGAGAEAPTACMTRMHALRASADQASGQGDGAVPPWLRSAMRRCPGLQALLHEQATFLDAEDGAAEGQEVLAVFHSVGNGDAETRAPEAAKMPGREAVCGHSEQQRAASPTTAWNGSDSPQFAEWDEQRTSCAEAGRTQTDSQNGVASCRGQNVSEADRLQTPARGGATDKSTGSRCGGGGGAGCDESVTSSATAAAMAAHLLAVASAAAAENGLSLNGPGVDSEKAWLPGRAAQSHTGRPRMQASPSWPEQQSGAARGGAGWLVRVPVDAVAGAGLPLEAADALAPVCEYIVLLQQQVVALRTELGYWRGGCGGRGGGIRGESCKGQRPLHRSVRRSWQVDGARAWASDVAADSCEGQSHVHASAWQADGGRAATFSSGSGDGGVLQPLCANVKGAQGNRSEERPHGGSSKRGSSVKDLKNSRWPGGTTQSGESRPGALHHAGPRADADAESHPEVKGRGLAARGCPANCASGGHSLTPGVAASVERASPEGCCVSSSSSPPLWLPPATAGGPRLQRSAAAKCQYSQPLPSSSSRGVGGSVLHMLQQGPAASSSPPHAAVGQWAAEHSYAMGAYADSYAGRAMLHEEDSLLTALHAARTAATAAEQYSHTFQAPVGSSSAYCVQGEGVQRASESPSAMSPLPLVHRSSPSSNALPQRETSHACTDGEATVREIEQVTGVGGPESVQDEGTHWKVPREDSFAVALRMAQARETFARSHLCCSSGGSSGGSPQIRTAVDACGNDAGNGENGCGTPGQLTRASESAEHGHVVAADPPVSHTVPSPSPSREPQTPELSPAATAKRRDPFSPQDTFAFALHLAEAHAVLADSTAHDLFTTPASTQQHESSAGRGASGVYSPAPSMEHHASPGSRSGYTTSPSAQAHVLPGSGGRGSSLTRAAAALLEEARCALGAEDSAVSTCALLDAASAARSEAVRRSCASLKRRPNARSTLSHSGVSSTSSGCRGRTLPWDMRRSLTSLSPCTSGGGGNPPPYQQGAGSSAQNLPLGTLPPGYHSPAATPPHVTRPASALRSMHREQQETPAGLYRHVGAYYITGEGLSTPSLLPRASLGSAGMSTEEAIEAARRSAALATAWLEAAPDPDEAADDELQRRLEARYGVGDS